MKLPSVQGIGRTLTHGVLFGLSAIFTIILVSLVYAAASWGSLPTVQSGSGLTATAWNDLVAHVNQSVKQTSSVITVSGSSVGIGNTNPGAKLDVAGVVKHDGVTELNWAGWTCWNESVSATFTHAEGSVFDVTMMFSHYGHQNTYGATRKSLVSNWAGPMEVIDLVNITSTYGGSWTLVRNSATSITIIKNAVTYPGCGNYFITVRGNSNLSK